MNENPSKWIRFLARLFDYSACFIIQAIILLFLPIYCDLTIYLAFAAATPLISAPFEALFLSKWGTTLGNSLFQLKSEEKPPFLQALKRALFLKNIPAIFVEPLKRKRKYWAIFITLLAFLTTFLGNPVVKNVSGFTTYQSESSWAQYTPEEGGFSIAFPSDPKKEEKQIEMPATSKPIDYLEYKSMEPGKVAYSVSYLDLPRKFKLAGNNTLLKGAMKVILDSHPGAQLIRKTFTYHRQHPALDFLYKQGNEEVVGRLILVGTTLFKLTVTYPPSRPYEELRHLEFLESFDLRPKESKN